MPACSFCFNQNMYMKSYTGNMYPLAYIYMNASIVRYEKINDNDRKTPADPPMKVNWN